MTASDHLNQGQFHQPELEFPDWRGRPRPFSSLTVNSMLSSEEIDVGDNPLDSWEERATGRLLHRSGHDFKPGDLVLPASNQPRAGGSNYSISSEDHAYAIVEQETVTSRGTPEEDRSVTGVPRSIGSKLYEVEPIFQDFSFDTNWSGTESIRSNKGFVVKGGAEPDPDEWRG